MYSIAVSDDTYTPEYFTLTESETLELVNKVRVAKVRRLLDSVSGDAEHFADTAREVHGNLRAAVKLQYRLLAELQPAKVRRVP